MSAPLPYEIKLKVQRANAHIADLNEVVSAFLDSGPYRVRSYENRGTREFHIDIVEAIPWDVSLIIGDVVHNLRSALDHLACQLVARHSGPSSGLPDNKTAFPVWRKPVPAPHGAIKGNVKAKLRGAHPDIIKHVKGMGAHEHGRAEHIWLVDHLDIIDKHRLLVVAGASNQQVELHFGAPHPPASFTPNRRHVHDGDVIFRQSVDNKAETCFTFDIALDVVRVTSEEPVVPLLTSLSQRVLDTLESFAPYL